MATIGRALPVEPVDPLEGEVPSDSATGSDRDFVVSDFNSGNGLAESTDDGRDGLEGEPKFGKVLDTDNLAGVTGTRNADSGTRPAQLV